MASVPFSAEKLNESKTYWQKHIALKADDADPYYWIGVIDWKLAYNTNMTMRATYNHVPANYKKQMHDDQTLPAELRDKFAAQQATTVDEGLAALKKATELRQDYDDAIAYLSLMDRQKADLTSDAPLARCAVEGSGLVDGSGEADQTEESRGTPSS